MHADLEEILYTEETIDAKIRELGARISGDYADKEPLIVCVLKGAVMFTADLVKRITIPIGMDFIAISSYGASTKSSGVVRILKDLEAGVEGRHLLICEDIIDSGLTLSYLRDVFMRRNAASVRVAALFDKPDGRKIDIQADYCGFQVPDRFIVGYGLDYAERYRNLPCVGVLKREVYA